MALDNLILPFEPSSNLRKELRDVYLQKALEWLTFSFGEDKRTLRSAVNDNPWETAYSVLAIIRSKKVLNETSSYHDDYDHRIENAIYYLLSIIKGDQSEISWDNNPYDTGLATQALLMFYAEFPKSPHSQRIQKERIIERTLAWITRYLSQWLGDRTIGELDDISQCLIAVLRAMKLQPNLPLLKRHSTQNIVHGVAQELLTLSEIEDEAAETSWADNIYSTSYILITLQDYLEMFPNTPLSSQLMKSILSGLRYLELEFANGWEQPPDTAIALECYLRSSMHERIHYDILPEIVFQGFRWLCDSKQRYQNGSIQRSVHYTVLFVNAILSALENSGLNKEIMDQSIILAYDYVLRQITFRDAIERGKLAHLRLALQEHQENHRRTISGLEESRSHLYRLYFIIAFLVLIILLPFVFSFVIGYLETRTLTLQVPHVLDYWQVLLLFVVSIAVPLLGYVVAHFRREYLRSDSESG